MEVQREDLRVVFIFFSIKTYSFFVRFVLAIGAFDRRVLPPGVRHLIAIFGPGYRNSKCPMLPGLPGGLPRRYNKASSGLIYNIAFDSNILSFTFSGCANLNNSIPRFFEVVSRARNEDKIALSTRIRELPG